MMALNSSAIVMVLTFTIQLCFGLYSGELSAEASGQTLMISCKGATTYSSRIMIDSAVYGANCLKGFDESIHLGNICNNLEVCTYTINSDIIGDPAVGCDKTYTYSWACVREYKLVTTAGTMTWDNAEQYCQNTFNTSLATITSEYDREKAYKLMIANGIGYVWIGLHDPLSNNLWQWSDGTDCSYAAGGLCIHDPLWAGNEPNNINANCTIYRNNKWLYDAPCTNLYHPLCNYEIPENGPTCVDIWHSLQNTLTVQEIFNIQTNIYTLANGVEVRCCFIDIANVSGIPSSVYIGTMFEYGALRNLKPSPRLLNYPWTSNIEYNEINITEGEALKLYRWSFDSMYNYRHYTMANSIDFNSYLLMTCNKDLSLIDDFFFMEFHEDFLTKEWNSVCYDIIKGNIRGTDCVNGGAKFWQTDSLHFHCNSGVTGCACSWVAGSINSEDNFGYYAVRNQNFKCSETDDSTTDYWIGSIVTYSSSKDNKFGSMRQILKESSCNNLFEHLNILYDITKLECINYCENFHSCKMVNYFYFLTTGPRCYVFENICDIEVNNNNNNNNNSVIYYKTYNNKECINEPIDWVDDIGDNCNVYSTYNWCNNGIAFPNESEFNNDYIYGLNAIDVCCDCGGGINLIDNIAFTDSNYWIDYNDDIYCNFTGDTNSILYDRSWGIFELYTFCEDYLSITDCDNWINIHFNDTEYIYSIHLCNQYEINTNDKFQFILETVIDHSIKTYNIYINNLYFDYSLILTHFSNINNFNIYNNINYEQCTTDITNNANNYADIHGIHTCYSLDTLSPTSVTNVPTLYTNTPTQFTIAPSLHTLSPTTKPTPLPTQFMTTSMVVNTVVNTESADGSALSDNNNISNNNNTLMIVLIIMGVCLLLGCILIVIVFISYVYRQNKMVNQLQNQSFIELQNTQLSNGVNDNRTHSKMNLITETQKTIDENDEIVLNNIMKHTLNQNNGELQEDNASVTETEKIKMWLKNIGLQNYYQSLVDNGFDDLESIECLNENTLLQIGITNTEHRSKLMTHINDLHN